jgi:hypothetical protein
LPLSQYALFGGVVALIEAMSHGSKECHYLCSELVTVTYEDHFDGIHEAVANIEEISSTEVTLLLEENLEPGLPVSFQARDHYLHGVVESSDFDYDLGWFVQIELDSTSPWSALMFVPEHFLALFEPALSPGAEAVAMRSC